MRKALIFGGSGQVGRSIAAALLQAGWQVDTTSKAAELPDSIAAARHVPHLGSRAATIRAGQYDAVIDTLAFDGADAADLVAARGDFGQLLVISTASVYADATGRGFETGPDFPDYPQPIPEDQPTVPPGAGYSAGKVALEQGLVGALAVILRPGAIHGIGARHPREWWVLKRLLDGRKRIPLACLGQSLFHTTAADGMAGFAAICLTRGLIGTFNIADPDAPTLAQIAHNIMAATGLQADLLPLAGDDAAGQVGHSPWSVPRPLKLSIARALAAGWDGGPGHRASMPAFCAWMQRHRDNWQTAFPMFARYGHDPFDYAAEDALLAAL